MTVEVELVAGRYKLIREVGRGGMGAVWLAHDELLGRDVALKRLGQVQGSQNQARAKREAQLAARLSHPNVVTVFDLAEDAGTSWLVMEYVEGPTLAQLAADHRGLPVDEATAIVRQAAEALRVAHDAGIVHRDVKPSNLIVAATDGTTKLTDFGIARGTSDETLTSTGVLTGSPAYLAPEVASGAMATPASDMWSLGASLYQALTGGPPYDLGDNVLAGLVRVVQEQPPPPPPGSGRLATVLAATMVKEPELRWTAAQVCAFLDAGDGTRTLPRLPPIPATTPRPLPPPAPARVPGPPARGPRRWWPVAAAAALVVLALLLGAWLLGRSGSGGDPQAGATRTPTRAATAAPTPSAPTSTAAPAGANAEAMAAFVTDYLRTVTRDPKAAYGMLTPAFQAESGGFGRYRSWWGPIKGAAVSDLRADPASMTVSYHVTYDGPRDRPSSDDVELRLVYEGGGYRIDGEPK